MTNPFEQQHEAEAEVRKIVEAFEAGFDSVLTYQNGMPRSASHYATSPDAQAIAYAVVKGMGDTYEEAIAQWKNDLAKEPQAGHALVWRVLPEIKWERDFRSRRIVWGVYSRFAVVPK